jgi:CoA:oxalate CoA-transferase
VLFTRLCRTLHLPIAEDPRFATNAARCENARLLKRLIEAVTLDHPAALWIERLTDAGIPTGPIQNVAEVMADRQIKARNMVVDILDASGEPRFKSAGNPIKISDMPDPPTRTAAPALDGDRAAILKWLADKG